MISYREYEDSYEEQVLRIISEVFKYDLMSNKICHLLAKYDLYYALKDASFKEVVLDNSLVVGFIFGSTKGSLDLKYTKLCDEVKQQLLHSHYAFLFWLSNRKISKINQVLLTKANKEYEASLTFFGLKKRYQGKGLGSKLYDDLVSYFKSIGIKEFYLFSDNYSNYQFYERKKMTRRSVTYLKLPFQKKEDNSFYLYDKKI